MNITIKDIAQKLGLSFSSVSKALNNKPGVSNETRELIIKTADEMGYRPNVIARGLVSRTTKTIAVIIPDIINPIFGKITTGIIETANIYDYEVFLCITNWNVDKELHFIHTVRQKQVDGVIIHSINDSNSKVLENVSVPVVEFGISSINNKFSSISTDDVKAGFIAANHLIDCGYKETAIIAGPANSSASLNRRSGIQNAYHLKDLQFDKSKVYLGEYNIDSGYSLTEKVFSEHPETDSIIAGNDIMALGVLQYLQENNHRPGTDIGVIGFDNIKMASLPQINLTTVKQPKYSIGRIMTKVLLDEIANASMDIQNFPQKILLDPELIIRNTTNKKRV